MLTCTPPAVLFLRLLFAACAVVALLERTGFPDVLGREWIFVRMHDAVQTCLAAMISDGQAVRPLSAYDSQALTPRATRPSGPGPLLFHPPGGRDSPTAPGPPRRSPASMPSAAAWAQQLIAQRARRSLDGGGSGTSPLLPQKYVPGGLAGELGLEYTGGHFDSPKIGTGPAGVAAIGGVASMGGSSSSSSRPGRPESAPGYGSSSGGGVGDQPAYGHTRSSYAGVQHIQAQPRQGLQHGWDSSPFAQQPQHAAEHVSNQHEHQQLDRQCSAAWAASAAAAAGATAAGQRQGPDYSTYQVTAAGGMPSGHETSAAGATSVSAPLVGLLPGPPPPPVRVSSRRGSMDGTWPVVPVSASSVAPLPPPCTLGGLHLHISPSVLHHPAVLSRAQSLAGDGPAGQSGPPSTSSSLRRPVSPRTERLLDDVFSASNGDSFLAADSAGGSQSPAAMLQLTEIYSEEPGTAAGARQHSYSQHSHSQHGYSQQEGGALSSSLGGFGSLSAAGGSGAAPSGAEGLGEVRLLLGHSEHGREHEA